MCLPSSLSNSSNNSPAHSPCDYNSSWLDDDSNDNDKKWLVINYNQIVYVRKRRKGWNGRHIEFKLNLIVFTAPRSFKTIIHVTFQFSYIFHWLKAFYLFIGLKMGHNIWNVYNSICLQNYSTYPEDFAGPVLTYKGRENTTKSM